MPDLAFVCSATIHTIPRESTLSIFFYEYTIHGAKEAEIFRREPAPLARIEAAKTHQVQLFSCCGYCVETNEKYRKISDVPMATSLFPKERIELIDHKK